MPVDPQIQALLDKGTGVPLSPRKVRRYEERQNPDLRRCRSRPPAREGVPLRGRLFRCRAGEDRWEALTAGLPDNAEVHFILVCIRATCM
jgi:hypothetical protein